MSETHPVTVAGRPVRRPAPSFAAWLLLVAPIMALLLAISALLAALMVFPLGDLTPLFVMGVSLLARRWEGVHSRLFDLSAIMAGVALLEWAFAYFLFSNATSVASPSELQRIGHLFTFYLVQLSVMLPIFAAACLLSRSSVLRIRRQARLQPALGEAMGSSELLILSDIPREAAAHAYGIVASRLSALLPYAELEHVGSTAVPGCIGKGDIDVLVRVPGGDFAAAKGALDTALDRSPRNEMTDSYIEYDWQQGGVSASVQLVVAGGFHDGRFRGFKSVLLGDPDAVERYNALKASCAGMSMDLYRERKQELIDELLAGADGSVDPLVRPGVHV